ncbi:ACP S-malonyltransferase [Tumebacillus sp. DT12]|uniref:Malonyl CoA-acyl carrier protein transacylase n=1 Tax=Tumebacillus lacus TaxID=2995335 RepID=A0ABT3WUV2_9BACL|nr:ACP S-malonyltransferase [Tumebacillus lacus]MCX7568453.1 ACP S-malonyltransferase [Tumebacillus lacus]
MSKYAFVFPGQGAQVVGMGKAMADAYPEAAAIFKQADEALGFSLSEIIWEGPEDKLRLTYYTQPAILTASIALYEVFKKEGIVPVCTAGHSLGEYSALVAAGALTFSDAVRLVHMRGTYMDEAVPAGQGAMSAVMGMDREELSAICADVSAAHGPVELANVNCPGQIVISGKAEAVSKAGEVIKELDRSGVRVIPLVVSGPFHSSLMAPAADRLAEQLAAADVRDAQVPVIANCTASPVSTANEIRTALKEQVASAVLWEDSVRTMLELGVDTFVEIGPGKVLSGLIKKVDRKLQTFSIQTPETLDAALAAIKGE